MLDGKEEQIGDWVVDLGEEGVHMALDNLDLRRDGDAGARVERIHKWLTGEYNPRDFVPSLYLDPMDIKAERVSMRRDFIRTMCEEYRRLTRGEAAAPHPLEGTLEDSSIRDRLQRTLHGREEDEEQGDQLNQSTPAAAKQERADTITGVDGKEYTMPPGMMQHLQNLQRSVRELREQVQGSMEARASSTHAESTAGNPPARVTFAEEAATSTPSTPKNNNRGGLARASRRSTPETPSSDREKPRDVVGIVRKWEMRFAGTSSERIERFLNQLEKNMLAAKMSDKEKLAALPYVMTGMAAEWYYNNNDDWRTWEDFHSAAIRWYGTNRQLQQRLTADVEKRFQGAHESVRDYVTCLRSMMSELRPAPTVEQALNILHRNLRPELQRLTPRRNCYDWDSFRELATEAETVVASGKDYRAPPTPAETLYSNLAYSSPTQHQTTTKTTKVAALAVETPADPNAQLAAMFSKMLDERLEKFAKGMKGSSQSHPNRHHGSKQGAKGEKEIICYNCHKKGHMRRECPEGNEKASA